MKLRMQYIIKTINKLKIAHRNKRNGDKLQMLMSVAGFIYWDRCLCRYMPTLLTSVDSAILISEITKVELKTIIDNTLKIHAVGTTLIHLESIISYMALNAEFSEIRLSNSLIKIQSTNSLTTGYQSVLTQFKLNKKILINEEYADIRDILDELLFTGM